MYFKPDWEDAKKRFEALWHQELVDRCCISVFAPKAGHEEEFRKGTCIYSTLHAFEPEEVLAEQERYFSHCFFGGESLPDLWLNYGAAGHAGYFDPPQGYNHGSFWIGKKIYDYEKDKLVFDPNNAIMRKQEEMASFIAKHCKDRYLISTPDNSGQLDALSLLRGANDLLLDFYDDPEYVHESLDELYKAWD